MITEQHIKEGLSRAYALAVGHRAGMNCSLNFEYDYKIDGCYREVEMLPNGKRSETGFQIDFQLKASKNVLIKESKVIYDLEVDNYNHLIKDNIGNPRVLILFKLPDKPKSWLNISEEKTILRNCAWWCSLKGKDFSKNSNTIRIEIPRKQILTSHALTCLMNKVSSGDEL